MFQHYYTKKGATFAYETLQSITWYDSRLIEPNVRNEKKRFTYLELMEAEKGHEIIRGSHIKTDYEPVRFYTNACLKSQKLNNISVLSLYAAINVKIFMSCKYTTHLVIKQ